MTADPPSRPSSAARARPRTCRARPPPRALRHAAQPLAHHLAARIEAGAVIPLADSLRQVEGHGVIALALRQHDLVRAHGVVLLGHRVVQQLRARLELDEPRLVPQLLRDEGEEVLEVVVSSSSWPVTTAVPIASSSSRRWRTAA